MLPVTKHKQNVNFFKGMSLDYLHVDRFTHSQDLQIPPLILTTCRPSEQNRQF